MPERRYGVENHAVDDDEKQEAAAYLAMLRRHKRVLDTDDPQAPLPPGVTHVLVSGEGEPRLIERRKSAV